jgi:hypothetical protein
MKLMCGKRQRVAAYSMSTIVRVVSNAASVSGEGRRWVGVGVYEHGCREGVEFALDGIEAGVAEGDVVIYASDSEAVDTQACLGAVDFFESGGGVVGRADGEEAEV